MCVGMQGSRGAELSSALKAPGWDSVVRKGSQRDADASSPFRDLHGTDLGLASFLRERGVQVRQAKLQVGCAAYCDTPCDDLRGEAQPVISLHRADSMVCSVSFLTHGLLHCPLSFSLLASYQVAGVQNNTDVFRRCTCLAWW